jgi:hypothetical protein
VEFQLLYLTVTTKYTMTTEQASKVNSEAVRIKRDKKQRAARVARMQAAKEDRRVSAASVIDEILESGLAKKEKQFGIV